MIRFMIWVFLGLVFGAGVGWIFSDDTGYVLIQYGSWTLEMTFALFCGLMLSGLLGGVGLFWGVRRILSIPVRFGSWARARKTQKRWVRLETALNHLLEGNFAKAEKGFMRVMNSQLQSEPISLIGSALANQAIQNEGEVALRLMSLEECERISPLAIQLFSIYLLLQNKHPEVAIEKLKPLLVKYRNNRQVLKLHYLACSELRNWSMMVPFLDHYRKRQILLGETLLELEAQCACDLLKQAAESGFEPLRKAFHRLSTDVRFMERVVRCYADSLLETGSGVEVEKELSALLEKYWDPDLLTLYSRLRMASYDRMFQRCEKWLESHPEDPYLFYITGLLAFRCQIWGRARTYIEQSLKMDPHPETYVLMGQLLEELNEASLASNCFRQASIMLAERAQYDWYAFPKETACV